MKKIFTPPPQFSDYFSVITTRPSSQLRIKKFLYSIFVLLLMGFYSIAQVDTNSQWTWMSGDSTFNQPGVYGTQGITSQGNKPGSRENASSWIDSENNLWIIGGLGLATGGSQGWLNDLWKYNPSTNAWTWKKGDNITNQPGVYGIEGMPASGNKPGGRDRAVSWKDFNGNFWLMGGRGYALNGFGTLNDLWKFDAKTNEWTWKKGDNLFNQPAFYGIKGIPDQKNKPGGRWGAVSWTSPDGMLWMMGGYGYEPIISGDYKNDLWKYDPLTNQWTWVNGDDSPNSQGIYGTKGIPDQNNMPGGRHSSISWTNNDGKLWLLGGIGYSEYDLDGYLNDLWKYDPLTNEWTWVNGDKTSNQPGVYGTKGIPSPENKPSARKGGISWIDTEGNFWLLGGEGISDYGEVLLNDLWKYDPKINLWTWVNGDSIANQSGIYGVRGIGAVDNKPGSRQGAVGAANNTGNLILMGGSFSTIDASFNSNDLWIYDLNSNTWTWMKGDNIPNQPGLYGTQGMESSGNKPGSRWGSVNWTDNQNTLWLFGGEGFTPNGFGWLNDLWNYNPATNEWTWVKGDNTVYESGRYGTQGVPADENNPGGRHFAGGWLGADGKLWLFGGYGSGFGYFNDLWRYDPQTNQWTWMKGDMSVNQSGVYGTKGISSVDNKPGGREHFVCWTGTDGRLWMIGGYGFSTSHYSDVWNYNPVTNEWTWINGDNTANNPGIYGTMGIASPDNKPGGRWGAIGWLDNEGQFWLIGGQGYGATGFGYLNDLWKYNPVTNQWTWQKGDFTANVQGIYGSQGIPASDNKPGGRTGAVSWNDADDKFWLFGGNGYSVSGNGSLNDLWKYDPLTNEWTWMKGDKINNQLGVYGTIGIASLDNKPGGREQAMGWSTQDGRFWLFGGNASNSPGVNARLNDLWSLTPTNNKYFRDADGDGYGNPAIFKQVNYIPEGYVLKSGDCNDNNSAINPGATEICDGVDNNCDGVIDEVCLPIAFVNDIIVREGDNGFKNAVFTVWLKGKSANTVSLHYKTVEGSATAPEDYMSKSGTITFAPNCLVQTITVKVRGDKVKEQTEKFRLLLSDPVNAIIRNNSATCTILDDDKDPHIKIHDAKAEENNQLVKIKVSLNQESPLVVKVLYDTRDKSARSPADYTGISNGKLVFLPGETEKYIQVVIKKDNINEKTEEFEVVLKDALNANLDYGNDNKRVAEVKILNSQPSGYECYGIEGNFAEMIEQPLILQVKALPNPSQVNFRLNITSNGREAIQLRVTDLQGRLVEARKLEGSAQQIKMGDNWRYGTYILEVIQGDQRKTIQLVKLR